MNSTLTRLILSAVILLSLSAGAAEVPTLATNAPVAIELQDQYAKPQRLAFPGTNVTIITIADRKGSEQVDGWIAALTPRYNGRIDIRGIADLGGAPGFVHGRICRKFRETCKYPVMMDWSGRVCAQFGCTPGLANIIVVGRDGGILSRFAGPAVEPVLGKALKALDQALREKP